MFLIELPPSKKITANQYSLEPDMVFGFFFFIFFLKLFRWKPKVDYLVPIPL